MKIGIIAALTGLAVFAAIRAAEAALVLTIAYGTWNIG